MQAAVGLIMNFKKKLLLLLVIAVMVFVYIHYTGYFQTIRTAINFMPANINLNKPGVWPVKKVDAYENMDLYLRMTTNPSLVKFYISVFVQSMNYFWPEKYSVVVVLDQEKPEDHVFGDAITQTFPFPRKCFMETPTVPGYSGFDRMQRDMFYPENCTSKKYVGYVDSDTMFITRVIPEMLFIEDKPIVIGVYGNAFSDLWSIASHSTANIFKTKEVMKCMSYFPVIIKVEHVIKMREYLELLHNMSFEEVLQKLKSTLKTGAATTFSQFNLMCQYVWMFHRNEYVFRLQFQPKLHQVIVSQRQDPAYYDKLVTAEQKFPIARTSVHYKYVPGDWTKQETYRHLLRSGICFSGGFELCPDKCKQYNKSSVRTEMFEFDLINWTWDKRCIEAQNIHYKEAAKYSSSNYSDLIRKACNEVDTLKWSV